MSVSCSWWVRTLVDNEIGYVNPRKDLDQLQPNLASSELFPRQAFSAVELGPIWAILVAAIWLAGDVVAVFKRRTDGSREGVLVFRLGKDQRIYGAG